MSFIPLSLFTKKKKSNLQILHITFCKYIYILNLKNRNGLPNNYFVFSILKIVLLKKKFVLRSGNQICKI